jgi:peptidoglycan hydrolase-like protein with peptidoglycan-binding domain
MVQEKLIDLGLLSGPATGDNDKSTQQAIKSFQEKGWSRKDRRHGWARDLT